MKPHYKYILAIAALFIIGVSAFIINKPHHDAAESTLNTKSESILSTESLANKLAEDYGLAIVSIDEVEMEWQSGGGSVATLPATQYLYSETSKQTFETINDDISKLMSPSIENEADSPISGQRGFMDEHQHCLLGYSYLDLNIVENAPVEVTSEQIALTLTCEEK